MPGFSTLLRVTGRLLPERGFSIRFLLISLVTVCVVPVWIAASLLVNHGFQAKRTLVTSNMLERSHSLSMILDRELASVQSALTALATSPSFAAGDLASVRTQAAQLLQSYPGANVSVFNSMGRQLVNLDHPQGTILPRRNNGELVGRVFQTGRPVISNLYLESVSRKPVIAIDVPVLLRGRIAYDLSMTFHSSWLATLLSRHQLLQGGCATLLDGNGMVIARAGGTRRFAGRRGCAAMRSVVRGAPTGIAKSVSLEGVPVFQAYSRMNLARWTVVIGMPEQLVTGELRRWLAWSLAGGLLLSVAGVALFGVIARNIAGSIRSLIQPAAALGRGEPLESLHRSGVREVDELGQALMRASDLARERLAERDRALELVSQGEQRYRSVVESQTEMILRFREDGSLSFVNHVFCRLFGKTGDELLGKSLFSVVFSEDGPLLRERLRSLSPSNPVVVVENRVCCASGELRWIQFVNSAVFDRQGELLETQAVGRDVTKRKLAETGLRDNQELLQSVINGAEEMVFVKDRDGRFILVNPALLGLWGRASQDVLGKHSAELYADQADAALIMEHDRRIMEHGRSETVEESVPTASGYRLLSITKMPRFDGEGRVIGVIGVGHDITERRLVETEQKATIKLLHLCNLAAGVGELVAELDRFFRETTGCGNVSLRLLGDDDFSWYDGAECSHPEGAAFDAGGEIGPADCHGDSGWLYACLCGRVLGASLDQVGQGITDQGGFWTNSLSESAAAGEEGRAVLECGRCNHKMYESVALLPLRSGEDVLGILQLGDRRKGCFTNNTIALLERLLDYTSIALSKLLMDEALSRSEQSLRDAQEIAGLGSFIYSVPEDRCLTSAAADRICGVDARYERTRAGLLRFIHPDHREEIDAYLSEVFAHHGMFDREFRIVRINDGVVRWLHMLGSVERGDDGSPLRMMGTIHDITDRKQAEEELRAYARRIMDVEENLRKVVATELHDEIGRDLTVLGINLSIVATSLPEDADPCLRARMEDSSRVLESISRTVRNIMSSLRPPVLDDYGLAAALRWYGDLFSRRTGIRVAVRVDEDFPRLAAVRETALFRIAQEAFTNVAKYAEASNVLVSLWRGEGKLYFSISDDGRGSVPGAESRTGKGSGWGMTIMHERAELIGGLFRLDSSPGRGVEVSVELPEEES